MSTRVVNINRGESFDVFIGRGSPFGNPFTCKPTAFKKAIRVASTNEAILRYRTWLISSLELPGWKKPTKEQIRELRGKTLGCFCVPQPCHGEILVELAERDSES